MDDIVWKDVVGYEGLYIVSNKGDVMSLGRTVRDSVGRTRIIKSKIMSKSFNSKRNENDSGYYCVRLTNKDGVSSSRLVHVLVAKAFIPNPENKRTVNHIDGNKLNNNLSNLEWATDLENNLHAISNGLRTDLKKVVQLSKDGSTQVRVFNSIHEAGRVIGINYRNIHLVCNNMRNSAGGYKWKYYNRNGDVYMKNLKQTIFFAGKDNSVKIPSKIDENGGYDIYANFSEDYIVIQPHETKMIPTGLHSAFSSDYVAILKERGSTGTKGIGQRCGVIDSGFRGEWQVPLTNHNNVPLFIAKSGKLRMDGETILIESEFGNIVRDLVRYIEIKDFIIYPYEKAITQCIMVEVPKLKVKEVTLEEIMSIESERGTGMLGSSNK